ncbi:MAG: PilZ domain-containing protein [Deltaproteobacteria bacterium]|nr:PilZ domain-containing protein [Deltaproteobacteria bacterium]MBW2193734.1 PilZ domain-containing protein [Deltaproteobacteria bacterium]
MTTAKPQIRRRKWKRFRINGSAIVMLHRPSLLGLGKPTLIELGPIIDISLGGLAIQYVDSKKRQTECFELSISVPDKGIVLEGLPYEIILDREVATLPDSRKIRNRCVQFEELTSYQKLKLEAFIKKHTAEIIRDRRSGIQRRQLDDTRFHEQAFKALHEKRVMGERRKPI